MTNEWVKQLDEALTAGDALRELGIESCRVVIDDDSPVRVMGQAHIAYRAVASIDDAEVDVALRVPRAPAADTGTAESREGKRLSREDHAHAVADFLTELRDTNAALARPWPTIYRLLVPGVTTPDSGPVPITLSSWVDGISLQSWIVDRCQAEDCAGLRDGARRWLGLLKCLHESRLSHGQLSPQHVVVQPTGGWRLIDLDRACTDELANSIAVPGRDTSSAWQHPGWRNDRPLGHASDTFPGLFVWLALELLSHRPQVLLRSYGDLQGSIGISADDLESPAYSDLFAIADEIGDPDLSRRLRVLFHLYEFDADDLPTLGEILAEELAQAELPKELDSKPPSVPVAGGTQEGDRGTTEPDSGETTSKPKVSAPAAGGQRPGEATDDQQRDSQETSDNDLPDFLKNAFDSGQGWGEDSLEISGETYKREEDSSAGDDYGMGSRLWKKAVAPPMPPVTTSGTSGLIQPTDGSTRQIIPGRGAGPGGSPGTDQQRGLKSDGLGAGPRVEPDDRRSQRPTGAPPPAPPGGASGAGTDNSLIERIAAGDVETAKQWFDARFLQNCALDRAQIDTLFNFVRTHLGTAAAVGLEEDFVAGVEPLGQERFALRWGWPEPRFSSEVFLGISPTIPQGEQSPEAMVFAYHDRVQIGQYLGGYKVVAKSDWAGHHVLVWAVIDLRSLVGMEERRSAQFYSGPLHVGTLPAAPPPKQGLFGKLSNMMRRKT